MVLDSCDYVLFPAAGAPQVKHCASGIRNSKAQSPAPQVKEQVKEQDNDKSKYKCRCRCTVHEYNSPPPVTDHITPIGSCCAFIGVTWPALLSSAVVGCVVLDLLCVCVCVCVCVVLTGCIRGVYTRVSNITNKRVRGSLHSDSVCVSCIPAVVATRCGTRSHTAHPQVKDCDIKRGQSPAPWVKEMDNDKSKCKCIHSA